MLWFEIEFEMGLEIGIVIVIVALNEQTMVMTILMIHAMHLHAMLKQRYQLVSLE